MTSKLTIEARESYKPKDVRRALNITDQTLRYWRDRFDPRSSKKTFTDRDLYAYGIIEYFIGYLDIAAKKLLTFDWEMIFKVCHQTPKHRLSNYVIYRNKSLNEFSYVEALHNIDTENDLIQFVTLKTVMNRINNNMFPEDTTDNIIDINSKSKCA